MTAPDPSAVSLPKPRRLRSHLRFTSEQSLRLLRDQTMTGKTIPWLLKHVYFRKELAPPALDPETRAAVRRELAELGNVLKGLYGLLQNVVQSELLAQLAEGLQQLKTLKSFLGRDYGDR